MYLNNENLAYIAKSDKEIYLIPKMANRHGLIAGATGTGKTITLKVLAETFSDMGTPVFLAGETRFERATGGFGDRCSTVEPLP